MLTVYVSDFVASKQPQPFPLQGSKRRQVPIINNLIPLGNTHLIEPFCGSAAVSIGARLYRKTEQVNISDSNLSLIRLWKAILTNPSGLADRYTEIWLGQLSSHSTPTKADLHTYFDMVRNRYNDAGPENGDPADFLFLLNKIVKGALRYGKNGRMNQSADSRRLGAKPSTVQARLEETSCALQGTSVDCIDYHEALSKATDEDIIYLDPPYQGTTATRNKRYISGLSIDDFEEEIRRAVARELSLIISYDALRGKAIYGRPLDYKIDLLPIDIITGVSAQSTLLGHKQEAHETLYLSPALVQRLGGIPGIKSRLSIGVSNQGTLLLTV